MRWIGLILGVVLTAAASAQDVPKKKKKPAVKPTAKTEIKAHQKPTPEQIRRFNELQKKK